MQASERVVRYVKSGGPKKKNLFSIFVKTVSDPDSLKLAQSICIESDRPLIVPFPKIFCTLNTTVS